METKDTTVLIDQVITDDNDDINNNNNADIKASRKSDRIELLAKKNRDIDVVGYVLSKNAGSSEEGYKFIITKGSVLDPQDDTPITMVTLPMYSLPSACMWIEYHLVIRKPEFGSIYRIIKIKRCAYREVRKSHILKILISRRRNSEYGISMQLTDKEKMIDNLTNNIKNLPEIIKSTNDLNKITKKREGSNNRPDWLEKKLSALKEEIKELLAPCFKGPIFLSLLCFFDSSILLKLNNTKLRVLYSLVYHKPYVFCFWEQLSFILSRISIDGKRKLFKRLDEDGLHMDHGYITNDTLLNQMVNIEPGNCTYSPYYPVWPIARLKMATEITKCAKLPDKIEVIRDALSLYFDVEKQSLLFGNTRASLKYLNKNKNVPYINDSSIRFLIDNGILQWARGDLGANTELSMPRIELEEYELANFIQDRIRTIGIVNCRYYNSAYTSQLLQWLNNGQEHAGVKPKDMLLLSANMVTAQYISNRVGYKFVAIDDYRTLFPSNAVTSKVLHIVIDRVHKISVTLITKLLKKVARITQVDPTSSDGGGGAHLYLFGDAEDFKLHHRRGVGDIMNNFMLLNSKSNVSVTRWDDWEKFKPGDVMYSTYLDLSNKNGINTAKIIFIPLDRGKTFAEELKNVDMTTTKKSKKKDYHIFCSNKKDKKEIMTHIYKKRLNMNTPYDEHIFYLGQKVHVLEKDVIGKLEEVYSVDRNGERTLVSGGRTEINIKFGQYLFSVCGLKYDTRKFHIEHADVMVITNFAGSPAERGIFVVGETTTRKQLFCASKYIHDGMKFFTLVDQINSIPDGIWYTSTDLISKLKLVDFKHDLHSSKKT